MKELLFIIVLIFSFVCKGQYEHIRSGDLLYDKGYYKEAATSYTLYLNSFPRDVNTQLKLSKSYLALFDEVSAEKPLMEAFRLSKRVSYEMYFTRGIYYQFKHKYNLALKDFRKVPPLGNPELQKKIIECENGIKAVNKPIVVKLINLGEPINSPKNEVLPQVTADDKQLFFSSYRTGAFGGNTFPMDVYTVKKENDKWGVVEQLNQPINSTYNEACVGISADGHQMYLYKGSNGGDLFISFFRNRAWQKPVAFPFNTKDKESSMTISPDGKHLLFVRKETGQASTLYSSLLDSDSVWSVPKVFELNSSYDEETPFFHADGKTLFFSSKRNGTIGSFDVFLSQETNEGWSKPKNVGYPLNTSKDELGFVLAADGTKGYYSSFKEGGVGEQDIYEIRLQQDFLRSQMVLLSGVITNQSQEPIETNITIIDLQTQKTITTVYSNSIDGGYLLPLECEKEYGIRIEKKGYLFYSSYVFVEEGYTSNKYDVVLSKELKGQKTILNNVFFGSGQYDLDAKSTNELLFLVELLKDNPDLKIQISGHTDNVGKEEKNLLLSKQRAEAVKAFLQHYQISGGRITTKGFGSSQPIVSNHTKEGRSKNRRTEFELF